MYYGPAFITASALIIALGGPHLFVVGLIMFKIGFVGFELHLMKELQRVGIIKAEKQIITF